MKSKCKVQISKCKMPNEEDCRVTSFLAMTKGSCPAVSRATGTGEIAVVVQCRVAMTGGEREVAVGLTLGEKSIHSGDFHRDELLMNVVLLGPPGSGKGTQAELLRDRLGFVHYSTGEVFRDHIKRRTPVGLEVEEYVSSGRLVPDDVVLEAANAFVSEHAGKRVVFDGFPRTIPQAEGLDRVLEAHDQKIDMAVLIDLEEEAVVERLTARRQCRKCGRIFNLSFSPPAKEGICDECGGELYQRDDDSEAVIRDRLKVYREQTEPLIEYYQDRFRLERVKGEIGRDRVFEELSRLVGAAKE